jgi:hypothetical protein
VADESKKNGRTVMPHARENTGRRARDVRVFFCFIVAGMILPMSLFLHAVLSTYGVVLTHLHTNPVFALAIFQHFCEAYVGVHPSVALFRVFYDAHLDASGAIFDSLIFRLRPHMVTRYIAMSQRNWGKWWEDWCFLEFSEEDDQMAYAEPMAAPEVLPIWTALVSMDGLEAMMERIQQLCVLGLCCHHVVNSLPRCCRTGIVASGSTRP